MVPMAYTMTSRRDFGDLASGKVLHSVPNFPAFPVRLADEIFRRAVAFVDGPDVSLWDPCCGSGYLATVVGFLNRDRLRDVVCSDISEEAIAVAARNLRLLSRDGLADRARTQRARAAEFEKPGYADAADAAERLAVLLDAHGGDLPTRVVHANALDPASLAGALPPSAPDLVITDVPYGQQTAWIDPAGAHDRDPLTRLSDALGAVLRPDAVVAICASGRKVTIRGGPPALARFRLGTRSVVITRAGRPL